MRKFTCATLVAIAVVAAVPMTGGAIASATPPGSRLIEMPLVANLRACDGTQLKWVVTRQTGRAFAQLSTPGSNTVRADVTLITAEPNTHYDVRLIQVPRPTNNCAPGDPGVIAGGFETDAIGAGGVSLQGPIQSGATGAWVVVDRPAAHSQTPAEFYTPDFVAAI